VNGIRALLCLVLAVCAVGAPALAQEPLLAEGEINNSTPTEQYEIDLVTGQHIVITTQVTAGTLDTVLSLFNPAGDLVAENDDLGDGSYNSQIIYTADRSGTHIIEVRRYDDTTSGRYDLLIEFNSAGGAPASAADAETLEGEGTLDDVIQSESYELELQTGEVVTITTEAISGDLDTVLILYNPGGEEAASNDDRGDGTYNSQIVYTVTQGGVYTIEVTRYDETSQGDYRITVEFAGAANASSVETIFTASGSIDNQTTSQAWQVDLQMGDTVVISADQTDGNLDTTLELYNADDGIVASNDDRGDGSYNSEIVYLVEMSGTYTIIVSRYDETTNGTYDLVVTSNPNATPDFSFVDVEGDIIAQFDGTITSSVTTVTYELDLEAGTTLYAATEAISGDLDTVISLVNANGRILAVNDDRGDGTYNSSLAYTIQETGTYSLVVGRYEGSQTTGSFVLVVKRVDASVVDAIGDTSNQVVSLSGPVEILETEHFRIRYTLSGSDATTEEYVNAFANTLEEMYDIQIIQMGWAEPPLGADGLFDAYLADVIGGAEFSALGYARPLSMVGDNPNTPDVIEQSAMDSVLVVDNDYYLEGSDVEPQVLMRATTTHEFNHMIQFGYDSDEPLSWLFEATAVWIETVTVGNDQDATGYIDNNNQYPELCFTTSEQDGLLAYGDWTFLQSLTDRHGEQIVRRLWENAVEYSGLDVIEITLSEVNDSLEDSIAIWRVQNLAADYDLGSLFPRTVWLENTIDALGDWTFTGAGIQESGANYYDLDLKRQVEVRLDGPDALELWHVGIDGEQVEAFRLGSDGTIDPSNYRQNYLMVLYRSLPRNADSCRYLDYSIQVSGGQTESPTEPTLVFSAENFRPLR
jgi:hypothetical protein